VLGLRRLEKKDQVPNGGGWNSCSFHPTPPIPRPVVHSLLVP